MLYIAITTGDADGIGAEVTAKALKHIGPQEHIQFFLWRSPSCDPSLLKLMDQKFFRKTCTRLDEALSLKSSNSAELIDICHSGSAAHWVVEASTACKAGQLSSLCTAPLSKITIQQAGFQALGHTDLFKQVCQTDDLFMAFLGSHLNVVLMTDHIPFRQISHHLTKERFMAAARACKRLGQLFPRSQPIGVLGLNPHAGEQGLLGSEEQNLSLWLEELGDSFSGPLVPDAAFLPDNRKKYALFLCLYHDQGLIPFKALHGHDQGVHLTLGLPFIRTSVDHGTAKDIFGQNMANPNSMINAITTCIKLSRKGVHT